MPVIISVYIFWGVMWCAYLTMALYTLSSKLDAAERAIEKLSTQSESERKTK